MLKERKHEIVDELAEEIRGATAMIVADYRGLSVGQLRELRKELRPLETSFRVSKNTLTRVAADRAGDEMLGGFLTGPTAIAFVRGGEVAAVAKRLSDTARTTRLLALRGAVVDGQAIGEDGVKRLATLPAKDVLQAQVVGVVAAPLTGLVSMLAAAPRELVVVLDQIIQKKQEQEAA